MQVKFHFYEKAGEGSITITREPGDRKGDAFLILDQFKVSPPLQRRITSYLDTFSMDERIRLIRKGGNV